MGKKITILILMAFASTLILMMPTQTKAANETFSITNPGPASKPSKWTAETPQPGDIGGANFTFYNVTTPLNSTFFINVTVSGVTQMKAWGIGVIYDNTTLQYVSAWRPTDHVFKGVEDLGTSMVAPAVVVADYNATHQEIQWGCAYIMPDPPWTFNGTGVLCQIQFRIIAPVNDTEWVAQFNWDPDWTAVYYHPTGNEVPNLQPGYAVYKIPEFTTIALLSLLATASAVIVIAKNRNKRD